MAFGFSEFKQDSPEKNYKKVVFATPVFEGDENKFQIKKKLLKNVKSFELCSDFEDIHCYIFNKRILNVINDEKIKKRKSFKNDMLPFLINHHYHDKLKNLYYFGKNENNDGVKLQNLNIAAYQIESPHYAQ